MGKLKGLLLLALVVFYAMQVVLCEEREWERRRGRERGPPEQEEERRAEEEEWRRREKTAEEERRRRREREWEEEEEGGGGGGGGGERPPVPVGPPGGEGEDMFVMRDSRRVVTTEAGEMRVVRARGGRIVERPLHIGFITMEPRSMFVPQYLDSSLVIFLRRGEAKLGLIYKDEFVERQLRLGDVYRIPGGSTFYIVNTGETQRLHIVCSIDPSEGLGFGTFQSFFVGGGVNPVSVLAGFDPQTLSTAFNVSIGELRDIMTAQSAGPIIFADPTRAPSVWANFLKLKDEEKLMRLKMVDPNKDFNEEEVEEEQSNWSWGALWGSFVGKQNKRDTKGDRKKGSGSGPDPYNLYDRDPDFRNAYGWSTAVDGHAYGPLKKSGVGVFLVNLTAGSMMAPHINPTATEYGIVLSGRGNIQVVFPNGTSAMNTKVSEGDIFWIPKYFPFCQIASRTGNFEFFGFTTSAHKNRPQFLVGASSILNSMRGPELATAFGLTEERFDEIVSAQREAIIFPSPAAAPPDEESEAKAEEKEGKKKVDMPKLMRSLGHEMVMGFE